MQSKLIWLCALVIALQSCNSYKKQLNQADAFYSRYPNELAKLCALKFPVRDSLGDAETSEKKADNTNYQPAIDSLAAAANEVDQQLVDSGLTILDLTAKIRLLKEQISRLQRQYKPCKPDTITITRTVYRANTAQLSDLQADNINLSTQLKTGAEENGRLRKELSRLQVLLFLAVIACIIFTLIFKR